MSKRSGSPVAGPSKRLCITSTSASPPSTYSNPPKPKFECPICEVRFWKKPELYKHINCHDDDHDFDQSPNNSKKVECFVCFALFATEEEMQAHVVNAHQDFMDPVPGEPLEGKAILNAYRGLMCPPPCNLVFKCRDKLQEHFRESHPEFYTSIQVGEGSSDIEKIHVIPIQSSLGICSKYAAVFEEFNCDEEIDERKFFNAVQESSFVNLKNCIKKWKNLRVFFSMRCKFSKTHPDGSVEVKTVPFTSFRHLAFGNESLPRIWTLMTQEMTDHIEDFTNEGSGWTLDAISQFQFVTIKYQFTKIGTYIETPYPLSRHTHSLTNVNNSKKNMDNSHNKCFLWSVLAHDKIAGVPAGANKYKTDKKVSTYIEAEKKLNSSSVPEDIAKRVNTKGLNFPMTIDQLPYFEEINPHISMTVLSYDMDGSPPPHKPAKLTKVQKVSFFIYEQSNITILYNSKEMRNIHVDLMCLNQGNNAHFILIRNLEALMKPPNKGESQHICRNCLCNFTTPETLEKHTPYCMALGIQRVRYPRPEDCELKFNKWARTQPVPFRFYADFEAFLPEFDYKSDSELDRQKAKAPFKNFTCPTGEHRSHLHKPCGYSWVCVDFEGKRRHGEYYHAEDDDEDVAAKFIKSIMDYSAYLGLELDGYEKEAPGKLDELITPQQRRQAANETECCFCKESFQKKDIKVRHHTHLPPFNYIGMAHQYCNLQAEVKKEFPVFMHNFSSYDVHFLIQAMGDLVRRKVINRSPEVIAKTSEKYMCVTIKPHSLISPEDSTKKQRPFSVRFVDSLGFTLKSLDKLVEVMRSDSSARFPITRQEFQQEVADGADIDLLFQKGAYPYSLMKSCSDFSRSSLPPKEDFYNDLKEEDISDKVYQHALKVWESFKIQNMGEWHDLYVRLDVSLLADVMEGVRQLMIDSYELDVGHYLSLPMMAIDCVLKKSPCSLNLITDPTMHCWIEHAIRGGYVSVGSQRTAQANNKYMGDEFDDSKPISYIIYVDANNLYGCSMSYPLPVGDFKWLESEKLQKIEEDVDGFMKEIENDKYTGYMLEVDLDIDPKDHDKLNDYPPAPAARTVSEEELSTTYQKPLIEDLKIGPGLFKVKKLVADLHNKKKYILHYVVLQQYLKMGLKVSKVHAGISFAQLAWMKPFIDFNTAKRKQATSEFAKDFWKLLNNSAFGKTIEQVRNRQNVRIVTSTEEALRYNKKPTVQNVIPINESTCVFMMKRLQVKLNKPIFTGVTVLDIAKSIMYNHHKIAMQEKYGSDCRLLYTDTDSLIYHVTTKDIYKDMAANGELYDMSEYPKDHPFFGKFYDDVNKKVLGKFKDECARGIITHIVCPRPKMYSIRVLSISSTMDPETGKYTYHRNPDRDPEDFYNSWMMEESFTKKVKGVTKTAVKNQVTFNDFVKVVEHNVQTYAIMTGFRSVEHRIFTEVTIKKALNGLDTKRYAVDNISTLAFGHKDIPTYES